MDAPTPKSRFKHAERVKTLRPDPNRPGANVVTLSGWLGPSSREGFVRIYRTPELDVWAEVREEDVLGVDATHAPGMPAEMSVLWVRAEARIHLETHARREVQADFLGGDIMSQAFGRPASFWRPPGAIALGVTTTTTTTTTILLDSYFNIVGACDWVSKKVLGC